MLTRPIALALALATPFAVHAQASDPAVARVSAYGQAVAEVARDGVKLSFKARTERFVPIIVDYYDLAGALALIAGPAWTAATTEQRSTATAAFARNSAIQHADNFKSADFALAVDAKTVVRGQTRLVRAHTGGETLIYRLRETGGRWRIIDVQARGVSQLAVQKADFATTVAKGGVPALTVKLNEINTRPHS